MSISIIDLSEDLQPITLLRRIEDRLSLLSRRIIDECKEIERGRNEESVKKKAKELDMWWGGEGQGEGLGEAIARLWLANFFWNNWREVPDENELGTMRDYCQTAIRKLIISRPSASSSAMPVQQVATPQHIKIKIRDGIMDSFSLEDICNLYFDLGIQHENLSVVKREMARELVEHCERKRCIDGLVARCLQQNPAGPWYDILEAFQGYEPSSTPLMDQSSQYYPFTVAKASAHYMLGLSAHAMGDMPLALSSYQTASQLFQNIRHSSHHGNKDTEKAFASVNTWIDRLRMHVTENRYDRPNAMLILPWIYGDQEQSRRYLLAELPLTGEISVESLGKSTPMARFLRGREAEWLRIGRQQTDGDSVKWIDGYKVMADERIRILDIDGSIKSLTFDLSLVHPHAQHGSSIVFPAGAEYHAFMIGNQPLLPSGEPLSAATYVLFSGPVANVNNPLTLLWHKADRYEQILVKRDESASHLIYLSEYETQLPAGDFDGIHGDFALQIQPTFKPREDRGKVYVLGSTQPLPMYPSPSPNHQVGFQP